MTIHSVLRENAYDFAIAVQETDIATEGNAWEWIDASNVSIDEIVIEVEPNGPMGSRGAGVHTIRGRRWWNVKFRCPAHGQAASYDPTADSPQFFGALAPLLSGLMGAGGDYAEVAYAAANVSPTDGNTVSCATDPGIGCIGALLAFGSTAAVAGCGFVEDTSGGGPYAVQFREDLGAAPGGGAARWPTATAYPKKDAPEFYTVRLVGEDTDQDYRFIGGVVTAARLKFEAETLWIEYELVCYGGVNFAGADGGLDRSHSSYLALEPMLGRGGARVTLGGNVISALDDATVDPAGSDDVRDLTWEFMFPHDPIMNPSAPENVSSVRLLAPNVTASLWVPRTDAYQVAAVDIVEAARANRTPISLCMYMGDTVGRVFAVGMRAGLVKSAKPAFNGGTWGTSFSLQAGTHAGDGASTGAGNKIVAVAVG